MKRNHSIRSRLRKVMVGFTILLCGLIVLLSLSYSWVIEDNVFNRMVEDEKQYLLANYHQKGVIEQPRFPFMTFYPSWRELPETVQLLRQQSPERIEFPLSNGGTLHIQQLQLGTLNGVLVADVSAYEVSRDYLPKLLPWLVFGIALFLAIALTIAYYFSRVVVDPVEYLAHQVKRYNQNDTFRLKRVFPDNEIGYLANVIERQFNRIQQALVREADFTRDVSHELRTPTAVIKMMLGRFSDGDVLSSVQLTQLKQSTQQIEQTVAVLLALAREETVEMKPLGLLEAIEKSVVNHFELSRREDFELTIDVAAQYQIDANEYLLSLLLNNILDNALSHASAAELDFSLQHNTLVIFNPLVDSPVGELLAPSVKHQHSQGIGQGLHLIKRICERFGWSVSVSAEANVFRLQIAFNQG